MGAVARVIMIVAGAAVALFMARDALSFPIWQGVVALLLIAAGVIVWGIFYRRP